LGQNDLGERAESLFVPVFQLQQAAAKIKRNAHT
jgi:hypothetical protein